MNRTLRFQTVGSPVELTEYGLTGKILELHDRQCQARQRNGVRCPNPSSQWMDGVGTRCRRHAEAHWCRVCAA